jgi:hypothetical protein
MSECRKPKSYMKYKDLRTEGEMIKLEQWLSVKADAYQHVMEDLVSGGVDVDSGEVYKTNWN